MTTMPHRFRSHLHRSAVLAWALCAAIASAQTPPPAVRPGQPITLNFTDAEIEAVSAKIVTEVSRRTGATLRS